MTAADSCARRQSVGHAEINTRFLVIKKNKTKRPN